MVEIVPALHVPLVVGAERKRDVAIGGGIDRRGIERLQEGGRFRDPLLQLREGGLVVLVARRLDAGEAGGAVLRLVRGDLHLTGEPEHIRRQAPRRQHQGIDFLRRGMSFRLVENRGERVEPDLENGEGRLRHRGGHGLILEDRGARQPAPARKI